MGYAENSRIINEKFEEVKSLDSKVFIEILCQEIVAPEDFRFYLTKNIVLPWMQQFNNNENYRFRQGDEWNEEGGIGGNFKGLYITHVKLYMYDGTLEPLDEGDYRTKRGLLIRNHYLCKSDVVEVHIVADNLCDFLTQEEILYKRTNWEVPKNLRIP